MKQIKAWAVVAPETFTLWRLGDGNYNIFTKRQEATDCADYLNSEAVEQLKEEKVAKVIPILITPFK
jgi:hypothetical protein